MYPQFSVPPSVVPVTVSPRKGAPIKPKDINPLSPQLVSTVFTNRPPLYHPEHLRVVRGPGLNFIDSSTYPHHPFFSSPTTSAHCNQ